MSPSFSNQVIAQLETHQHGVAAPPVGCRAYVPDFVIGVTTSLRSPTCE